MLPFVTATWSNLVMLSYAVDDAVLQPYVTERRQIDRWNGKAYVSVVGFYIGNTRIAGYHPINPNIRNFAQWNLRAYVKLGGQPGILFVEEFVPSPIVTAAVRILYHENYQAAPVRSEILTGTPGFVRYTLDYADRRHSMSVTSAGPPVPLVDGTLEHFLAERYVGCPANQPVQFHVEHPPWTIRPVASYVLNIDFEALYGDRWAFLNNRSPDSVLWCDGSN